VTVALAPRRRVAAIEASPGFAVLADPPRPELAPLLVAAHKRSGAAFVGLDETAAPARPRLRTLDLDAILAAPGLWRDAGHACGVAEGVVSRLRPIRDATHPPQLTAILAIRALALGTAVLIVPADAAPPPPDAAEADDVAMESMLAARLVVLAAIRRDLAAVAADDPIRAPATRLAEALAQRVIRDAKQWTWHRNRIMSQDFLPTWLPAGPALAP